MEKKRYSMTKTDLNNTYPQIHHYRRFWKENSNPTIITTLTKTQAIDNIMLPNTNTTRRAKSTHNVTTNNKSETNKHNQWTIVSLNANGLNQPIKRYSIM